MIGRKDGNTNDCNQCSADHENAIKLVIVIIMQLEWRECSFWMIEWV